MTRGCTSLYLRSSKPTKVKKNGLGRPETKKNRLKPGEREGKKKEQTKAKVSGCPENCRIPCGQVGNRNGPHLPRHCRVPVQFQSFQCWVNAGSFISTIVKRVQSPLHILHLFLLYGGKVALFFFFFFVATYCGILCLLTRSLPGP